MDDSTLRLPFYRSITHGRLIGGNYPRSYRAWAHMKGRCNNPKDHAYDRYGGRGIRVCGRWVEYVSFLEDMGEPPDGRTLDRIDNDSHYSCGKCPECRENGWAANCRWATPSEQNYNTRRAHRFVVGGRQINMEEASALSGLDSGTIRARRYRGLDDDDALFAPKRGKLTQSDVDNIRERYAAGGVTYKQLASDFGVTRGMIGFIVRREQWK